jgi:2-oxoglutarate ferredoxin oxidoreductase subunit gamma
MEMQIIIAGFGGQGILLLGQLLAYSGMRAGREVTWIPAYGAEMRGGAANCSVIISESPIGSPKVEDADAVIALNRPSMSLFERSVKPGGALIYNSSLINIEPGRADIRKCAVPCSEIADSLGNPRVANMVALGALMGVYKLFSVDTLIEGLREKLGSSRETLIPVNKSAIEAGMKACPNT